MACAFDGEELHFDEANINLEERGEGISIQLGYRSAWHYSVSFENKALCMHITDRGLHSLVRLLIKIMKASVIMCKDSAYVLRGSVLCIP